MTTRMRCVSVPAHRPLARRRLAPNHGSYTMNEQQKNRKAYRRQMGNTHCLLKYIDRIDCHERGSAEDRAQRDMLEACRVLIAATRDRHEPCGGDSTVERTHPVTRDDEPLCRLGPGGDYQQDYTPPRGAVGVEFVGRLAAWLLLAGMGVLIGAAVMAVIGT